MAKKINKKAKQNTELVFNTADELLYQELDTRIRTTQNQSDGLAKTIAGALYRIREKELFKIEGFKNVYDYAENHHGISRGAVSDAINVFKRFASKDAHDQIAAEYDTYAWRALIMMKSLEDDEIDMLGLMPTMSSAEIKTRIQDYKTALPEINERKLEKFTYDDVKGICEELERQTALEDKSSDTDDSTVEPESEAPAEDEYSDEYTQTLEERFVAINGQEALDNLKDTAEDKNALYEQIEQVVDEFATFPKKTVNIKDMNDKDAIAAIKALLNGVRENQYEIVITA